jgi:hypothetical protein
LSRVIALGRWCDAIHERENLELLNRSGGFVAEGHGGARPNSGPKPKRQRFEGEITKADKRLAKNLIRHIENMERLADGVMVEETNVITGKPVVYQRPPDRQANEYLINRIMGKPTERQEHKHEGEIGTYAVDIGGTSDSTG